MLLFKFHLFTFSSRTPNIQQTLCQRKKRCHCPFSCHNFWQNGLKNPSFRFLERFFVSLYSRIGPKSFILFLAHSGFESRISQHEINSCPRNLQNTPAFHQNTPAFDHSLYYILWESGLFINNHPSQSFYSLGYLKDEVIQRL